MGYEPLHGVHAVESAMFIIRQDRPVNIGALQQTPFRKKWQAELPARQTPQLIETLVNQSGNLNNTVRTGVEFAQLRQDGTAAWILRFIGNDIIVECTRYTDWSKVSSRVTNYAQEALSALLSNDHENRTTIINLTMVDRFNYTGGDPSYYKVLKPGLFLMAGPLASEVWHQHSGWFEKTDTVPVLNQLNVDVQAVGTASDPSKLTDNATLRIQHVQEMRLIPTPSDQLLRGKPLDLHEIFSRLHKRNLQLLRETLATEMATRIGLKSSEGSTP